MLSKHSYLFNKLTKSVENWYLTNEDDTESKNYIILFLSLFFLANFEKYLFLTYHAIS